MARTGKARGRGYRKATYPSAVRMARLVDEMPRHGLGRRLASVAEGLGVSDQTVRRYVKALNEEFVTEDNQPQFEIVKQAGEEWLVRRARYEDTSKANIYQLISVYLSLEIFKMLGANNLFVDLVDGTLREIEQKLSIPHRGLIKDLPRKFYSAPWAPKDYSRSGDVLSDVIKAIVYQNVVEIYYKPSSGNAREYTVHPLTLLHHKGGLYLIARGVNYDHPVYFNIERLRRVRVLADKFHYPRKYHPEQMLDGAFGIYATGKKTAFRLKFPAELAEYIRSRKWHKDQRCRVNLDGTVTLTLKVADSEEVRSWIRSFGDKVALLGGSEA